MRLRVCSTACAGWLAAKRGRSRRVVAFVAGERQRRWTLLASAASGPSTGRAGGWPSGRRPALPGPHPPARGRRFARRRHCVRHRPTRGGRVAGGQRAGVSCCRRRASGAADALARAASNGRQWSGGAWRPPAWHCRSDARRQAWAAAGLFGLGVAVVGARPRHFGPPVDPAHGGNAPVRVAAFDLGAGLGVGLRDQRGICAWAMPAFRRRCGRAARGRAALGHQQEVSRGRCRGWLRRRPPGTSAHWWHRSGRRGRPRLTQALQRGRAGIGEEGRRRAVTGRSWVRSGSAPASSTSASQRGEGAVSRPAGRHSRMRLVVAARGAARWVDDRKAGGR